MPLYVFYCTPLGLTLYTYMPPPLDFKARQRAAFANIDARVVSPALGTRYVSVHERERSALILHRSAHPSSAFATHIDA